MTIYLDIQQNLYNNWTCENDIKPVFDLELSLYLAKNRTTYIECPPIKIPTINELNTNAPTSASDPFTLEIFGYGFVVLGTFG